MIFVHPAATSEGVPAPNKDNELFIEEDDIDNEQDKELAHAFCAWTTRSWRRLDQYSRKFGD